MAEYLQLAQLRCAQRRRAASSFAMDCVRPFPDARSMSAPLLLRCTENSTMRQYRIRLLLFQPRTFDFAIPAQSVRWAVTLLFHFDLEVVILCALVEETRVGGLISLSTNVWSLFHPCSSLKMPMRALKMRAARASSSCGVETRLRSRAQLASCDWAM